MSFAKFYSEHLGLINRELGSYLDMCLKENRSDSGFVNFLYNVIKESSMSEGKRLRPLALMMSYFACGGNEIRHILLPAVAIELHQTYSLILDDIMDEDESRRGEPSAYKKIKDYYLKNLREEEYKGNLFSRKSSKFSVSQAMMAGNLAGILSKKAILSSSFSHEKKVASLKVIEDADQQIYNGQILDVLMESREKAEEKEYLQMIAQKTAAFFGMALEAGCVFAGADENKRLLFKNFGIMSATAFQIHDDLLDITKGKGHEIGSDIKKGKKTLLYIKAAEKAETSQLRFMDKVYGNPGAGEPEINKIIAIFHDTGSIEYSRRLADHYYKSSRRLLSDMKLDIYYNDLFCGLSEFMIMRNK